jgi:hypothetical protein
VGGVKDEEVTCHSCDHGKSQGEQDKHFPLAAGVA